MACPCAAFARKEYPANPGIASVLERPLSVADEGLIRQHFALEQATLFHRLSTKDRALLLHQHGFILDALQRRDFHRAASALAVHEQDERAIYIHALGYDPGAK